MEGSETLNYWDLWSGMRDTIAHSVSQAVGHFRAAALLIVGSARRDSRLRCQCYCIAAGIDDEVIGEFDAAQLGRGINLAALATPMSRQAQLVLDLKHRHNHLHHARWRLVDEALTPFALTNVQRTMEALDELEAEVIALQRATPIPKAHRRALAESEKLDRCHAVCPIPGCKSILRRGEDSVQYGHFGRNCGKLW